MTKKETNKIKNKFKIQKHKKEKIEKAEKKSTTSDQSEKAKTIKTPSLLRGMKDILPKEEEIWKKMYHVAEDISGAYAFQMMETPVLEDASLFIRSIGKGTDVVDKEMYVFEDKDASKVCLRPEATASIVRAYILHGMHSYPQPVKVWYYGSMFRHDRPQAGRFRQFHQFGCESIGEHDPVTDAELIVVAYNFLRDLGIGTVVQINSIGNVEDRQRFIVELVGYLRSKRSYLCEECKKRMVKNPLRVLDCKEESCHQVIEEGPQIIDWLSDESRSYFMKVLEYLDELEIPYVLKSTLVRGLDYYTDTVFELYKDDNEEGSQSALGGGGRYDHLVEQMGGQSVPACGFAIGLERVASALRKNNDENGLENIKEVKLFFAQLGEQAKRKALAIIENLRRNNITVFHNLGKSSLKAQLELANKHKAAYCLILGQKEVQDGTVIIRDMESGIQEIVDQKKLKQQIEKKLINLTKS